MTDKSKGELCGDSPLRNTMKEFLDAFAKCEDRSQGGSFAVDGCVYFDWRSWPAVRKAINKFETLIREDAEKRCIE